MEVGAVKQAFNNELILLKKKLNQAKIQIIHKLTRKAKTLAEKKAPENIKEKLKRKATAAVNEVLIIKKIKPKDLAKFIITHKGDLNSYLNKPAVDQDKVCARLLLHKSLQDKYKFIRDRFSSVPIDDLLMSREERKKLKKEAKEKQKNKKKGKQAKVVNAEGEWDVEDVEMPVDLNNANSDKDLSDDEDLAQKPSSNENDESNKDNLSDNETSGHDDQELDDRDTKSSDDDTEDSKESEPDEEISNKTGKFVKADSPSPQKVKLVTPKKATNIKTTQEVKPKLNTKLDAKSKDKNKQEKNKNLNEKLLMRKFKKDVNETQVSETKVVDSFFITSTGENYMSVVEPRPPDEVKDVHKQGNRKLRRAVLFGHVPKIKPRKYDHAPDNRFKKQNEFNNNSNSIKYKDNNSFSKFNENNSDKRKLTDKRPSYNRNEDSKPTESKPEKLHPSWEAKKRQSGIQPFQGKKIVFDES